MQQLKLQKLKKQKSMHTKMNYSKENDDEGIEDETSKVMANEKDKEDVPWGTIDFTNGLFNDKNFKDLVHNILLRWSLEENFFYLPLLSSDEDDCMPLDENNKWKIEDI